MTSIRCPACVSRASPTFLANLSQDAYVQYWRCVDCHHVWTMSSDGQKFLRHVTPLKPKPDGEGGGS